MLATLTLGFLLWSQVSEINNSETFTCVTQLLHPGQWRQERSTPVSRWMMQNRTANWMTLEQCWQEHPYTTQVINFNKKMLLLSVYWKLSPNCTTKNFWQISILNTFLSPKFVPKLWPHPKTIKIFENEKMNDIPTPNLSISYISWIQILHQMFFSFWEIAFYVQWSLKFNECKICAFPSQKCKNASLSNSLLMHYPWPTQIQKYPKDPNLKSWPWNW